MDSAPNTNNHQQHSVHKNQEEQEVINTRLSPQRVQLPAPPSTQLGDFQYQQFEHYHDSRPLNLIGAPPFQEYSSLMNASAVNQHSLNFLT